MRTIKYMLHIRPLSAREWAEALTMRRDEAIGSGWRARSGLPAGSHERNMLARTDTASLLLTLDPLGEGAEARWNSDSMDLTMPSAWREARCGTPRPARGPRDAALSSGSEAGAVAPSAPLQPPSTSHNLLVHSAATALAIGSLCALLRRCWMRAAVRGAPL